MPQQQPATSQAQPKLVHRHPNNERYIFTCRACRAEDAERSKAGVRALSEDDVERTTFLIPMERYDNAVCRAYLSEKYPNARWIGSSLDLSKLGGWADGEQIVVVRRDTWPKEPGVGFKKEKDVEGKWEYLTVPPETYLHEVVESAPIDVKATIVSTRADRFTKSTLDITPLIDRLSEQMPLPYRIDMPRDAKDSVLHFILA